MFDNLSDDQRKVLRIWFIVGLIILLLLLIFSYSVYKEKKENEALYNSSYTKVKDYSRYYTVASLVEKFYSYINSKDYNSVLIILNNDYKNNNSINIDNLDNYLPKHDVSIGFQPGLMCSKQMSKNLTSYYIKGNTVSSNTGDKITDSYYNIILDSSNFTYSISILSSDEYRGECN